MATLLNDAGPAVNLDTLDIRTWLNGAALQPGPDFFSIAADAGLTIEYRGRGFAFLNGSPTSGSIESIEFQLNGELWMKIYLDAAMTVPTLRSFVAAGDTQDFLARVLAGNDTIARPVNTADGSPNLFDGFAGNDLIIAGRGNDTLRGGIGNDTLSGNDGADRMFGGTGNDTYVVDDRSDVVDEISGSGIDTVLLLAGTFDLANARGAIENITLGGSATTATGNELNNRIIGNDGDNRFVDGGDGDDFIDGKLGNDLLIGDPGNDILIGGEGNDTLVGDSGRDTLIGGIGDDVYSIADGDTVVESPGGGTDEVEYLGSGGFTLGANLENLRLFFSIATAGTGNALDNRITANASLAGSDLRLSGLAGNDTLAGALFNDTLDGGIGVDSMVGGEGNDAYLLDNVLDIVDETGGTGSDSVRSSVSVDLSSTQIRGDVENVILTGMAASNATGNALHNALTGNAGRNLLVGLEGNDTLDGGAGADTLRGGAGDDVYALSSLDDVIQETGADTADLVIANFSIDLGSGPFAAIEHVTLRGTTALNAFGNNAANQLFGNAGANKLVGNGGDDVLRGNAGNDLLDGGAGKDVLVGDLGNDTYIVDDVGDSIGGELLAALGGRDTVRSSVSFDLSGANIGIEDLVLTGTGAIDGNGNQSNNLILGNDNNNVLVGREGSDTLTGGAGNDTLHGNVTSNGSDGPLNKDILNGGAGGDLYRIADGDTVIESLAGTAGGADTVHYFGSIGYTLGANVENLAIMGGAFATGNALDNHITGSAGGDRLSGMAGNDTIVGFGGNDTIDGGAGADSMVGGTGFEIFIVDDIGDVVDDRLGGVSSVHSSISFDLTENGTTTFGLLMNLALTGTKAINGTGNALPNNITGNGAANILDGGSGRDALNGGAGNDKLFGGAGAFFDALDGGAGADTMEGGDENDFYFVDNANDIVVETNGDAAQLDSVFASINNYALPDNVEVLRLEGGAGVGSGNNLANLMFGNLSRANKLFGLGGDDEMYGQDGADVLDGGAGDDTMDGGNGNDTYYVDSDRDVANDRIGSGVDTVIATADYLLAAGNNIERLTLAAGAGDIDGTGNELANLITGNEGNNKLGGGAGADTIVGGVGRDTLLGGDGDDKLDGGVDDDRLSGGAGDDTLTGGAGFDIFFHNAVTDGHDLITGFDGNASGGQDFLDLDALFDSLGIATADRADRVLFTDRGSSVEVRIDTDLNGTPDAHVATLVTPDVITVGVDIVLGTG